MRAFLLANATAATFLLRRASRPLSHGSAPGLVLRHTDHRSGAVNDQGSKVDISSLADPQQRRFAPPSNVVAERCLAACRT